MIRMTNRGEITALTRKRVRTEPTERSRRWAVARAGAL